MTEQIKHDLEIVPPPMIPRTKRRLGSVVYIPEFCQVVLNLMDAGASLVTVAARIGVHRKTLDDWAKRYDEFGDALEFGKVLSQAWWEHKAMKNMENKTFKEALWFMNMRNRWGWTNSDDAGRRDAPPILILATNLSLPQMSSNESYTLEITGEAVGGDAKEINPQ